MMGIDWRGGRSSNNRLLTRAAVLAFVFCCRTAYAADDEPVAVGASSMGARNYFHMRVGGSSGNHTAKPEVCAEVAPHERLSFQACGTGAGIWHRDPAPQLAHFRADVHLTAFRALGGVLKPLFGLGFAELQVGTDDPGFQFKGTGPRRVETSGPETALSLRYVRPLDRNFELIGDAHVGAAWLAHAPELAVPQSKFQPFLSIGVGVGF
jgi:hypothetical protein